ncbi:MAG: hypothetical protein MJE68_31750 [Proteobacteria bacterium]|nr:hypothetical protein [Pseudomonadota bacterium]
MNGLPKDRYAGTGILPSTIPSQLGFLSPTQRCKSWHTVVEQCGEPIAGSLYDASIALGNGTLQGSA